MARKKEKATDDLKQELMNASDLNSFLNANTDLIQNEDIQEKLNELFIKSTLSKAELARRSGISEVYLHQLFSGRRKPSRDRLICLAIGLEISIEETQELLRHCGQAELYARSKRDAVIIYGISHKMNLPEINDELFKNSLDTLV